MAADALAGRSALVTGASRGIGLECARMLASEGARVVMLARDAGALDRASREIGAATATVPCDLTDPDAVEGAIARVREALGAAPDIIVNSAGQLMLAPVSETSVAEFDRLLLVNLTAPFAFLRAFVPELRERGSGHIVTIGSLADRVGLAENAAYAASKFGLRGLHEVLREELRGSGVRATLVSPEHVDTAIWSSVESEALPDAARRQMLSAAQVANAVRFALLAPRAVNVDELRLSHA
jgi:NADP-dependent 3-hydroxy acid dehydrogenase YdfG